MIRTPGVIHMDAIFIAIILAFFAGSGLFAWACGKL